MQHAGMDNYRTVTQKREKCRLQKFVFPFYHDKGAYAKKKKVALHIVVTYTTTDIGDNLYEQQHDCKTMKGVKIIEVISS